MLKILQFSEIFRNATDQVYFTINAARRNILEMTVGSEMIYRVSFFSCLADKGRPNTLPAMLRTPLVGEVERYMMGARQTIAVIITFRKCNKKALERRTGAYRSSRKTNTLYFLCNVEMA